MYRCVCALILIIQYIDIGLNLTEIDRCFFIHALVILGHHLINFESEYQISVLVMQCTRVVYIKIDHIDFILILRL